MLRLIGKPIVFLLRDQLQSLKALAAAAKCPGQGSFQIKFGAALSATHIELIIEPADKSHEAVWKNLLGEIERLNQDPHVQKSATEAAFFSSVCARTFFEKHIGFDWPSVVRNRANYRPGFAYGLDRKLTVVLAILRSWKSAAPEQIYSLLIDAERSCRAAKKQFVDSAKLMINISVVLVLIMRALHEELWERRLTDGRWEKRRRAFVKLNEAQNVGFEILTKSFGY